jgi:hypothetical protein
VTQKRSGGLGTAGMIKEFRMASSQLSFQPALVKVPSSSCHRLLLSNPCRYRAMASKVTRAGSKYAWHHGQIALELTDECFSTVEGSPIRQKDGATYLTRNDGSVV